MEKKPALAYILVFSLFTALILSRFFPFFSNVVIVILLLPLFFYPLKSVGLKNIKKGAAAGFLFSLPLIPFINLEKITFLFTLNTFLFAFAEEIFFRGYLFKVLEIKNNHLKNVIVSLLFTLAHVIFYGSFFKITVFFPSLIFGYLYIYTGSILAPIIFHTASNLFYETFLRHFIN
jgi:membrane protease YdiL (CAAX protease family)